MSKSDLLLQMRNLAGVLAGTDGRPNNDGSCKQNWDFPQSELEFVQMSQQEFIQHCGLPATVRGKDSLHLGIFPCLCHHQSFTRVGKKRI